VNERTDRSDKPRLLAALALLVAAILLLFCVAVSRISVASPGPALTEITRAPSDPSRSRLATFTYTNVFEVERFECSLDGSSFEPCGAERPSSITYARLAIGRHVFRVRAVSGSRIGAERSHEWTIELGSGGEAGGRGAGAGGGGEHEPAPRGLSMEGSVPPDELLYPGGPAVRIPLTVRNESAVEIEVTRLRVAIEGERLPVGCRAAWFRIVQPNASGAQPLVVAPRGSVTLPAQGISAPTIRMLDDGNQDACKRATVHLLYRGSARW
jgi:hypothetical protein